MQPYVLEVNKSVVNNDLELENHSYSINAILDTSNNEDLIKVLKENIRFSGVVYVKLYRYKKDLLKSPKDYQHFLNSKEFVWEKSFYISVGVQEITDSE